MSVARTWRLRSARKQAPAQACEDRRFCRSPDATPAEDATLQTLWIPATALLVSSQSRRSLAVGLLFRRNPRFQLVRPGLVSPPPLHSPGEAGARASTAPSGASDCPRVASSVELGRYCVHGHDAGESPRQSSSPRWPWGRTVPWADGDPPQTLRFFNVSCSRVFALQHRKLASNARSHRCTQESSHTPGQRREEYCCHQHRDQDPNCKTKGRSLPLVHHVQTHLRA